MGFDQLACPIGGAFELRKIQISTFPQVGYKIDRCIIACSLSAHAGSVQCIEAIQ